MKGLSQQQVLELRERFGRNEFQVSGRGRIWRILFDLVREPMFILLVIACVLYFLLGDAAEGGMMVAALVIVGAISVFQEIKSSSALGALRRLTEPMIRVYRDDEKKLIAVEELVPGDIIFLEEGEKIPADAEVMEQNDLSVNESVLTGESFPVEKTNVEGSNNISQGTVVNSGRCTARITATGSNTTLGKIGKSIASYSSSKTQLQQQMNRLVKKLAYFGIAGFLVIFLVNFLQNRDWITSLLLGLTLAMSAIPEEIPVAFSSFMSLGAYHMSRLGIITRQPQTIENLGAINILCLDKTGTITENRMTIDTIYDHDADLLLHVQDIKSTLPAVLVYAVLASERNPFDAMEKAIVEAAHQTKNGLPEMKMVAEYALHGHPPMMTHVFQNGEFKIAAAKGAAERLIRICDLTEEQKEKIGAYVRSMAAKGHRVLGVASSVHRNKDLPAVQDEFAWEFKGLISFYDPPRPFIREVFDQFYDAGIRIKLLTGDFSQTALTIAELSGLRTNKIFYTGDDVMEANDDELKKMVREADIFTRMYPEAKQRTVRALIEDGNTVAMTGDGVNDGPAIKAADIGIAMGKKGTEVARQSADLIITDDDLRKLVDAIGQGRKIFANLKKAVRYIISIHIPIILTASLPLVFAWRYPTIFTPVHVIFLELIMGPTCSIFFEREPVEEHLMKVGPRRKGGLLFEMDEVLISVVQGFVITCGVLILYYFFMNKGSSLTEVRTIVFTTMVLSNIFLTFTNRSFIETFAKTRKYKNNLALPVVMISLAFLVAIYTIPFIRVHFGMSVLSLQKIAVCILTALVSVGWFEVYKMKFHFFGRVVYGT